MDKGHITEIENKITELKSNMSQIATETDQHLNELLTIIHQPGYTTPREVQFTKAILDEMLTHAKSFSNLKESLMTTSRDIIKERRV